MGDDEDMGVSYGVEFGEGAEQMAMRPKAAVRYRECLKNHAAAIGGHAVDGCGDFMPAGEDGTLEALRCAACGCHRNFHRRELDGENPSSANNNNCYRCVSSTPRSLGIAHPICAYPPLTASESPEIRDPQGHYSSKKRFRTKFTQEQKDQMLAFAQRLGWRIQKQDEASVQRFCVETGVRRQVLKVWMHNNRKQHQSSSSSVVADRSPSFD